jgi:hypothetical protein
LCTATIAILDPKKLKSSYFVALHNNSHFILLYCLLITIIDQKSIDGTFCI